MAHSLPDRPSLESLKKQAKALLHAWRRDEPRARARVRGHHPKPEAFSSLRDAQLVIAREYGLPGWSDLRESVEAARLDALSREERVGAFLDDACLSYRDDTPRRRRLAQRMLDADPSLATANVYTAAATASVDALRAMLAADPGLASRPGGPRPWTPLMYLTYARLPEPRGDAVEAARVLLEAGADPNAREVQHERYVLTALTGAMGEGEGGLESQPPHPRARALALLLLAHGADPNESQGLYNTHFTPGDEWIELLVAHGLSARDRANWMDGEEAMGTLDYLLGAAVVAGRAERVALLLDHGADPDGEDAYDHRPHYENALCYGHPEIAEILLSRGATRLDLAPRAAFRAACMAGDAEQARTRLDSDPSLILDPRLVHDAIRHGSDDAVDLILELGASLEAKGPHFAETPLHQAALLGRDAAVDRLLALGARLDVRDPTFGGTPVGWASHGGHPELRERLLDRTSDVGDLAAWGRVETLRERLSADPSLAVRTFAGGVTPLHLLRIGGDRGAAVIALLCEAGADPNARTEDGTTPLAAALARDDEDVAELLRGWGAREA